MRQILKNFLGLSFLLGLGLVAHPTDVSAQTTVVVTSTTPVPAPPYVRPGSVPTPPAAARTDGRVTRATAETDTEIRQREEENRITVAARSGALSPRERAHLARAMANLQAYQERAYADGLLTLREQARLARLHARIDRAITRAIAR